MLTKRRQIAKASKTLSSPMRRPVSPSLYQPRWEQEMQGWPSSLDTIFGHVLWEQQSSRLATRQLNYHVEQEWTWQGHAIVDGSCLWYGIHQPHIIQTSLTVPLHFCQQNAILTTVRSLRSSKSATHPTYRGCHTLRGLFLNVDGEGVIRDRIDVGV